jgi:hypothetical protein
MDNTKPTLEISEHVGNIMFEKKETITETKIFTLEEQMTNYSNEVAGIKVTSVSLPPNYDPTPKTETQLLNWLENKLNHRNTFAYRMSLKYGEKLMVKLEKKEPYNKN